MAKAFIFDMDGVIINTENVWHTQGQIFLESLYGKEIFGAIKDEMKGIRIDDEYELAKNKGFIMPKEEYLNRYTDQAKIIFGQAQITTGIVELIDLLEQLDFKIALVSSSPLTWINLALAKVANSQKFSEVISLSGRADLNGKPAPDGYLEAMKLLDTNPNETIIIEDSNRGLQSAINSGAFTICLREHLPKDYVSLDANLTIEKLSDLVRFIEFI